MKKKTLTARTEACYAETKDAVQTIWDSITAQGQKKKAMKDPKVLAILERYEITT